MMAMPLCHNNHIIKDGGNGWGTLDGLYASRCVIEIVRAGDWDRRSLENKGRILENSVAEPF